MGGGLMQLVAYGAQDIYLTGSPQITFFKVVYRRHTNFSMECIQQTLDGVVSANSRNTATISRNGDLIGKMFLEVTSASFVNIHCNPGSLVASKIDLEIGGQTIDTHYGHWLETYAELVENTSTDVGTFKRDSNVTGNIFHRMSAMGGVATGDSASYGFLVTEQSPIQVPLQFWFCRNPGLFLPLIALQYHEVKVIITFGEKLLGVGGNGPAVDLWVDYIYLDTEERRRFAQVSHEYLIEQVQYQMLTDLDTAGKTHDLHFNHPVKELIWTGEYSSSGAADEIDDKPVGGIQSLTNAEANCPCKWKLVLNGQDRFALRPTNYFTRYNRHYYHSGDSYTGPDITADGNATNNNDPIAVYSFSLKPEEHQPSGTCNFSRIDTAQLFQSSAVGNTACTKGNIYAVNYNILRIMSGMGGLAYSN